MNNAWYGGAEAQQENFECPDIEPYVYIDGYSDGLRWNYEGHVSIEGDSYSDEVRFNGVTITDSEIDEVIAPRGANEAAQ